jgi:plastocyanin
VPTGETSVDVPAAVGQVVRWVNDGSEPMELDFESPLSDPVGQVFAPGDSFEARFDAPGTYGFTCVFSPEIGKKSGGVVVTP